MTWRLLDTGPGSAAFNMAVDEAILSSHARGLSPPTVRFYTWQAPAVSLGRHQRAEEVVSLDACRRLGVEVVGRPTGGWAVLHDGDLTFSIAASHSLLGTASVMEAYDRLASGIIAGLGALGIAGALVTRRDEDKGRSSLCFAVKSGSDIAVGGVKIVGSAQVHGKGAVLQQNDLPLRPCDPRYAGVFLEQPARAALLASSSLERLLGRPVQIEEVKEALVSGFEAALGLDFSPGELLPEERRSCGA